MAERPVDVKSIHLEGFTWPRLTLSIACGKGTYIRSLARDIGLSLGCGGYVEQLRRTSVGSFTAEMGVSPAATQIEVRQRLLPLRAAVLDRPTWTATLDEAKRFRCGQRLPVSQPDGPIAVLNIHGDLIGLATAKDGLAIPEVVIPL